MSNKSISIQEALNQLIESKEFKEMAKADAGLRVYAGRIKKGKLSGGAAVKLLTAFGFKVAVESGKRQVAA